MNTAARKLLTSWKVQIFGCLLSNLEKCSSVDFGLGVTFTSTIKILVFLPCKCKNLLIWVCLVQIKDSTMSEKVIGLMLVWLQYGNRKTCRWGRDGPFIGKKIKFGCVIIKHYLCLWNLGRKNGSKPKVYFLLKCQLSL